MLRQQSQKMRLIGNSISTSLALLFTPYMAYHHQQSLFR